jgi:hypothetical protein
MVDVVAVGALMSKTHETTYEVLEEFASNNYQWPSKRSIQRKAAKFLKLDSITKLVAQVTILSK